MNIERRTMLQRAADLLEVTMYMIEDLMCALETDADRLPQTARGNESLHETRETCFELDDALNELQRIQGVLTELAEDKQDGGI